MSKQIEVGFVVSAFPQLSETFVLNQIIGLEERGFRVSVITDEIKPTDKISVDREPLKSVMGRTKRVWADSGTLDKLAWSLPGWKARTLVGRVLDRRCAGQFEQFDVLLAHFGHNGLRLARSFQAKKFRTPFLTIFHGMDVAIPHHKGELARYVPLFESRQKLLPVNRFFGDLLVEAGADPGSVHVQHMGVDCKAFDYRDRDRDGTMKIISVCRMVEKKGIEYAIRALKELAEKEPEMDWQYDIIGDGPLQGPLKQLAEDLGLGERVVFHGAQPHDRVRQALEGSHVFLLPSVTAANGDMEGIPVALMEAMASGLPVVSTVHSGIPELIENKVSGLLAPERDPTTLAAHIAEMYRHPHEVLVRAKAARRKVEQEFDLDKLNDQLGELLTQTVVGH